MAKTINEIGHNLELKQFVIHQVVKDAGDRKTAIKIAENLIAITKKEKQFIGSVNKIYRPPFGLWWLPGLPGLTSPLPLPLFPGLFPLPSWLW